MIYLYSIKKSRKYIHVVTSKALLFFTLALLTTVQSLFYRPQVNTHFPNNNYWQSQLTAMQIMFHNTKICHFTFHKNKYWQFKYGSTTACLIKKEAIYSLFDPKRVIRWLYLYYVYICMVGNVGV
jgi:hypothetical protein